MPTLIAGIMNESDEQVSLFDWIDRVAVRRWPKMKMLAFHPPNGGHRNKAVAAQMKREGVRPGVSDVVIMIPRGDYHGMIIELKKRDRTSHPSKEQKEFLKLVAEERYKAVVAYGWDEAREAIIAYMEEGR